MRKKQKKEKLPRSPEHQRQVRNRIGLIIFCIVLLSTLLLFNYFQQGLQNWRSIDFNLNIFLLINLNILLLVAIILLIIRNLVKLLYERRRRKLGFRLKFKLTLAFIVVSSLPMVMFFFIANGLLKNSMDFWFQGQFALAQKNSRNLADEFKNYQSEELKHFVKLIAADYLHAISDQPVGSQEPPPNQWLVDSLTRYYLDGIVLYDSKMKPLNMHFAGEEKKKAWEPLPQEGITKKADLPPFNFVQRTESGFIIRALSPLQLKGEYFYIETARILTGARFDNLAAIQKNLTDLTNLNTYENPIRTSFTTYLLLFTVAIIFGGIWFGYYLAGSIVKPIETLVEGTNRIARGYLDFQIDLQVDDEIGMLLDSFNSMTKELLQNRKKLAISQDALMETNRTLEERNILVELLLQNIRIGILSVDNAGFINGINPYMKQLFDLKQMDVIHDHYEEILNQEQIDHFVQLNRELDKTRQSSVEKDTHIKLEKRSVHVAMELFQLKNPKGISLGRLLVVDDLTEIDRSTRARAWREVARRIAHEIKNPLTPIQLSTQRIRRKYLEKFDDTKMLDQCTSTIIKEVNALKNMVNEFSKFARLPEINPSPSNINVILKEVIDLFKEGLPPLITINLKTDPEIPDTLLDSEQIKRVFTNLIDNAVAAILGAGSIDLTSSYSRELKMVTVNVTDTGCGVPDSMVTRIFDPYVTTKKDGTGLGLAIVQQIVTDHGGFIRLKVNENKQTSFTIELPA